MLQIHLMEETYKNDRSGKMFLLTSKFGPKGLSAPAPGYIYV